MNKWLKKLCITFYTCILMLCVSVSYVHAEDTEIYNGNLTNANVLFILDQSESMLQMVGSTGKTRDQIVKEAFQTVMSQSYQNLNVGFMDYGRDNGAGVDLPVVDINQLAQNVEPSVSSSTERYASMLSRFVNNLEGPQPAAQTALVEALLEAAKYYRGDIIDNLSQGVPGPTGTWDDAQSQYVGGHWRAAGPRTFSTGSTTPAPGSNCHAAGSPAGAPYSQCVNPFPGSCSNISATNAVTHQHGTFCPVAKVCTQYDATGTECITYSCPVAEQPNPTHSHPAVPAYTKCQETSSATGKQYISPIQSSCDKNFIVLLSDGGPTILGSHEQTSIQGFSGISPCEDLAAAGFSDPSILQKGLCGPDLVKAINQNDLIGGIPDSFVTTHTIGFQLGGAPQAQAYLQKLATDGGGQFFDANSGDPTQLTTILQNLLAGLSTQARTFATPTFTIDLGDPLNNRSEVYYSVFTPTNSPRWNGNVKGYFLGPKTSAPTDPTIAIRDQDQNIATDANGDFVSGARSFWTGTSDGADVTQGGFAAKLNPSTRTLFTDDGLSSGRSLIDLSTSNAALANNSLFGLPAATTNAERDELIDWATGVDVDDENGDGSTSDPRAIAGDPLHSVPLVAQYSSGPARVLYAMTNEGYIHAIKVTDTTSDGDELFAYMPSELLPNLDPLRRNVENQPKVYGLDGPLTLFQEGGVINAAGDKYLYFGMRRGGHNYYSLDVSNTSSPSLRWVIQGGTGGFAELAQTWSRPTPARVNISGVGSDIDVVVFGGGYDVDQDNHTQRTTDDEGRAVFIVNATTGAKLWSAGPDNTHDLNLGLTNSIPGGVAVIDLDADGIHDRLYFGDTGGRLWRVDLNATLSNSTGYKLADLASNGSDADNRRFYTEPSVTRLSNGNLGITIGSGYRAHPLNSVVEERLYMIYDIHAAKTDIPSTAPNPKVDGSGADAVADITANFNFDPSNNPNGWKIEWPVGRKIFANVNAVEGILEFSVYDPLSTIPCSGGVGTSRTFALDANGRPLAQPPAFYTTTGNTVWDSGGVVNNPLMGGVNQIFLNGMMISVDGTMISPPNMLGPLNTRYWLNLDTLNY